MIVVSGCPRSGTSLMMDIMRNALGDDRILGAKFPQEERQKKKKKRDSYLSGDIEYEHVPSYFVREEIPEIPEISKYISGKRKEKAKARRAAMEMSAEDIAKRRQERLDKVKDMNPNGFWECKYTVAGATYVPGVDMLESGQVVKIVSQGLYNTDPMYVEKIVFMLRDPRQVAKSQEKLGGRHQLPKEFGKIHSPEMFIKVTKQAARWLKHNPKAELLLVDFDELLSNPTKIGKQLQAFIGEGDFGKALSVIDPTLKRSKPQDIEHELWPVADEIFEKMKVLDYEGVIAAVPDMPTEYLCLRLGRKTTLNRCKLCIGHPKVRDNFKIHASNNTKIDWKNEPCTYECLRGMSIADSIKNNSWTSTRPLEDEIAYQEEVLGRMIEDGVKPCGIKAQEKYIEGLKA